MTALIVPRLVVLERFSGRRSFRYSRRHSFLCGVLMGAGIALAALL